MALPIKRTPVLSGKQARQFARRVAANEKKPVSRTEYERAKALHERMRHCAAVAF